MWIFLGRRDIAIAIGGSWGALDSDRIREISDAARFTSKETALFKHLAESPGRVVARPVLLRELHGAAPRTLDTYIRNMRKKLIGARVVGVSIETEVGKGFLLKKTS